MINLYNTHIENLSIHRVGNKSRNEAIFLSEQPYNLNDEIVPLLKEYFFKPFREKEENYFQFAHEVDLDYNDMYKLPAFNNLKSDTKSALLAFTSTFLNTGYSLAEMVRLASLVTLNALTLVVFLL